AVGGRGRDAEARARPRVVAPPGRERRQRDEELGGLASQSLPPEQGPTARRQLQQRLERSRRLGVTQATYGERTLVARERTIRGTIHQQGHRGVRRGLQRDREAQREAQPPPRPRAARAARAA